MDYGNLAYQLPERYDEAPKVRRRAKPHKNKRTVRTAQRSKKQAAARSRSMRRISAIVTLAASATFMISQFVAVNEARDEIASLERELAGMESVTSQMIFDMEQSVDLAEIEKQATTRLGMQRPEKYQTIYVNVRQNDMTEKTALEVEGVGKGLINTLKKIGGNIVNFFSIK